MKLDTTLCDKVCYWLEAARWFFGFCGLSCSSSIKTEPHDIIEILLKKALDTHKSQPIQWVKWKCLKRIQSI